MTVEENPPDSESEEEDTDPPTDQLGLTKEHYEKIFKRFDQSEQEEYEEYFKSMGSDAWGLGAGVSPSQPSLN